MNEGHEDDEADDPYTLFIVFSGAPSVDQQPRMDLREWRVIKDTKGNLSLFGFHIDADLLRMTTPIVNFNPTQRSWTTHSGRIYATHTEPGQAFADEVLQTLSRRHGLHGEVEDVTEGFWTAMLRARH